MKPIELALRQSYRNSQSYETMKDVNIPKEFDSLSDIFLYIYIYIYIYIKEMAFRLFLFLVLSISLGKKNYLNYSFIEFTKFYFLLLCD